MDKIIKLFWQKYVNDNGQNISFNIKRHNKKIIKSLSIKLNIQFW